MSLNDVGFSRELTVKMEPFRLTGWCVGVL